VLRQLGSRAIDRRTATGHALAEWRRGLLADLGGEEHLSTQELVLVEQVTRPRMILDSVDGWLFAQRGLVNRRTRSLLPVVRERTALVATLKGLLEALGLKRRTKQLPTLNAYLASKAAPGSEVPP
jgi:hypothetical protein